MLPDEVASVRQIGRINGASLCKRLFTTEITSGLSGSRPQSHLSPSSQTAVSEIALGHSERPDESRMSDPVLDEKSEKFASFRCDGNQPLCTQQREYSAGSRRKGPDLQICFVFSVVQRF